MFAIQIPFVLFSVSLLSVMPNLAYVLRDVTNTYTSLCLCTLTVLSWLISERKSIFLDVTNAYFYVILVMAKMLKIIQFLITLTPPFFNLRKLIQKEHFYCCHRKRYMMGMFFSAFHTTFEFYELWWAITKPLDWILALRNWCQINKEPKHSVD